jgi:hypothetical protein
MRPTPLSKRVNSSEADADDPTLIEPLRDGAHSPGSGAGGRGGRGGGGGLGLGLGCSAALGVATSTSGLYGRLRRSPNFQLLPSGQLRPMLRLPKNEFAILFIFRASGVPPALADVL